MLSSVHLRPGDLANASVSRQPGPIKLPFTSPSGAYIERGPLEMQLYARIASSDDLVAVLEVDPDCRGRVFHYFMRGGIGEGATTAQELRAGAEALQELLFFAKQLWPRRFDPADPQTL